MRARLLRRGDDSWQHNRSVGKLMGLLKLYSSHEVADTRMTLSAYGKTFEAVTDDEGFAVFDREIDRQPLPHHAEWQTATLSLPDHPEIEPAEATIMAPGSDGRLGIISDIDDTVIETGAHDFLRNWRRVMMEMPGDRLAVPGAAELFGKLGDPIGPEPDAASRRAFFYVSSSPWNLYGFLAEFKRLNGLPRGPMMLRDWGLNRSTLGSSSHGAHKSSQIDHILGFYPDHKFVLVGDDTQGDAEAYAAVVANHPNRVRAVFLRMATGEALSPEKASALDSIRATDTPVWTGPAFDAGHAMLDSLGFAKDGEAASVVEATKPE